MTLFSSYYYHSIVIDDVFTSRHVVAKKPENICSRRVKQAQSSHAFPCFFLPLLPSSAVLQVIHLHLTLYSISSYLLESSGYKNEAKQKASIKYNDFFGIVRPFIGLKTVKFLFGTFLRKRFSKKLSSNEPSRNVLALFWEKKNVLGKLTKQTDFQNFKTYRNILSNFTNRVDLAVHGLCFPLK